MPHRYFQWQSSDLMSLLKQQMHYVEHYLTGGLLVMVGGLFDSPVSDRVPRSKLTAIFQTACPDLVFGRQYP